VLLDERDREEPRVAALAEADGDIDVIAREVEKPQRGRIAQIDLGVRSGEGGEPRREPIAR
jgi:hypothetical protein